MVFSCFCANDIFRMLTAFYECLHEIVLPEQCPEHYLNTSIEEHSTYIASVLDGFDPVKCRSKYPICPGVILEGNLGEKVSLNWLTSPYLVLGGVKMYRIYKEIQNLDQNFSLKS